MREATDIYYKALEVRNEIGKYFNGLVVESEILLSKSVSLSAKSIDKSVVEEAKRVKERLKAVERDIPLADFLYQNIIGIIEQFCRESANPNVTKTAETSFIEFINSSTYKAVMGGPNLKL